MGRNCNQCQVELRNPRHSTCSNCFRLKRRRHQNNNVPKNWITGNRPTSFEIGRQFPVATRGYEPQQYGPPPPTTYPTQQSPTYAVQSPTYADPAPQSPTYAVQSPTYAVQSPTYAVQSPTYPTQQQSPTHAPSQPAARTEYVPSQPVSEYDPSQPSVTQDRFSSQPDMMQQSTGSIETLLKEQHVKDLLKELLLPENIECLKRMLQL